MVDMVLVYTDFDGTLTNRAGSETVFSDFYQSLFYGYQQGFIQAKYRDLDMKAAEEVQAEFVKKFGVYDPPSTFQKPDADMLINPDAINSLHTLLQSEDVKLTIVTRNRPDYIRAILKYQGLSAEEINKIAILHKFEKFNEVAMDLSSLKFKKINPTKIYILDDNEKDYEGMYKAAMIHVDREQITGFQEQPNQFNWAEYLPLMQADIEKIEKLPSIETEEELVWISDEELPPEEGFRPGF